MDDEVVVGVIDRYLRWMLNISYAELWQQLFDRHIHICTLYNTLILTSAIISHRIFLFFFSFFFFFSRDSHSPSFLPIHYSLALTPVL